MNFIQQSIMTDSENKAISSVLSDYGCYKGYCYRFFQKLSKYQELLIVASEVRLCWQWRTIHTARMSHTHAPKYFDTRRHTQNRRSTIYLCDVQCLSS